MILLSGWALAGLVLLAPLVVLHLRRGRLPRREVPSLLLWRALPAEPSERRRRIRLPLPLLLLLQALALSVLVLALARPGALADAGAPVHVFVVDDSVWMQARGSGAAPTGATGAAPPGTRLGSAESDLSRRLTALPPDAPVRVVLAANRPTVWYSGPARRASAAVARVASTDGAGDLGAAVRLAGGLRRRATDPIAVFRAPEDPLPRVTGSHFTATVVGGPIADRALVDPGVRCDLPPRGGCEAFARVRNDGVDAVDARVEVANGGTPASATSVRVPAGGSAPVAFEAPPGARLTLQLAGSDPLPADDRAFVAVPPAAPPVRVTLVGDPATALPLAGALAAVPGAKVALRTTKTYRASDARASDLVVLDGALPGGLLPPTAGVLLVAPPRLPGGGVGGAMTDAQVTGLTTASPLLRDVDLTSLALDPTAIHRFRLPDWMTPVVTAPSGPLLAAGTHNGQRVALLAFDPADSSLPQLATFPILVANLVAWTQQWVAPESAPATPQLVQVPPGSGPTTVRLGDRSVRRLAANGPAGAGSTATLSLLSPGIYDLSQSRRSGTRTATVAVNLAPTPATPGAPVDLARPGAEPAAGTQRVSWAPWLLGFALLVLVGEWLYARRVPRLLEV